MSAYDALPAEVRAVVGEDDYWDPVALLRDWRSGAYGTAEMMAEKMRKIRALKS